MHLLIESYSRYCNLCCTAQCRPNCHCTSTSDITHRCTTQPMLAGLHNKSLVGVCIFRVREHHTGGQVSCVSSTEVCWFQGGGRPWTITGCSRWAPRGSVGSCGQSKPRPTSPHLRNHTHRSALTLTHVGFCIEDGDCILERCSESIAIIYLWLLMSVSAAEAVLLFR